MSDIYASPTAELDTTRAYEHGGSLARGIAGDYEFSIGDALGEAWQRTRGAKLSINLALLLYIVASVAVSVVVGFAFLAITGAPQGNGTGAAIVAGSIIQQMVITALLLPMGVGLFMLGLRRAVDAPLSATRIFGHYDRIVPLFFAYLVVSVLVLFGFFLLIIPGIYLVIAFVLAMPLVVEKKLSPWDAIVASLKAVTKRWFAVFGFGLVLVLINFIAMLPLGIGLIWTAPMSLIAMGVLYRQIFGCEAATRAP